MPALLGPDAGETWVSIFTDKRTADGLPTTPFDLYVASLYWSIMT